MMAEMTTDPRGDVTRSISGWEIFSSVRRKALYFSGLSSVLNFGLISQKGPDKNMAAKKKSQKKGAEKWRLRKISENGGGENGGRKNGGGKILASFLKQEQKSFFFTFFKQFIPRKTTCVYILFIKEL
jgi:hypothetical protein